MLGEGLQGQMIPMAIPMSLIQQEKQLHRVSQSIQPNSPKKKMQFAFAMPEQVQSAVDTLIYFLTVATDVLLALDLLI